jgi:hypothetical protein
MTEPQIVVDQLSKTYLVPERDPGLAAALKSLVHHTYRDVDAVRDIAFSVEPGEIVGFIGPNGAGKTTTLKMLCGLLYPTAGEARVMGYTPWERKPDYLRQISMVLGNKSQMVAGVPPLDSFYVLAEIYGVAPAFLLTGFLREASTVLTFRYIVGFPVEVLTGQLDSPALSHRVALWAAHTQAHRTRCRARLPRALPGLREHRAGTCAIGAYNQVAVDAVVGVGGPHGREEELVVYMAPVGKLG